MCIAKVINSSMNAGLWDKPSTLGVILGDWYCSLERLWIVSHLEHIAKNVYDKGCNHEVTKMCTQVTKNHALMLIYGYNRWGLGYGNQGDQNARSEVGFSC